MINAFGQTWRERDGSGFGPGDPWSKEGSTLIKAPADGPFKRGAAILLNAEKQSAGVQLDSDLGFGRHTVLLKGRLSAFEPGVVAAVWTHHDELGAIGTEVDFEHSFWNDPNNPVPLSVGVIKEGSGIVASKFAPRQFTHWKIELEQMPKYSAVRVFGYRASDARWIDAGMGNYGVRSVEGHTLRIALWRLANAEKMKAEDRVSSSMIVYGHSFEAL